MDTLPIFCKPQPLRLLEYSENADMDTDSNEWI